MYKYTKISDALNYVSDAVRDHVDESKLIQWFYDGYKNNIHLKKVLYDYCIAVVEIKNHQARLPKNIKKLFLASFSNFKNDKTIFNSFNSYIRDYTEDGDRIILAQGHILNELKTEYNFLPMIYTGQNNNLIANSCYKIYDDSCSINYSVDKSMEIIRTSAKEGYAVFVYMGNPLDVEGELIIPDNSSLLTALGKYAEMQYMNSKRMSTPSYENIYRSLQQEANQWFKQFVATHKLENLDVYGLAEIDHKPLMYQRYDRNDYSL